MFRVIIEIDCLPLKHKEDALRVAEEIATNICDTLEDVEWGRWSTVGNEEYALRISTTTNEDIVATITVVKE